MQQVEVSRLWLDRNHGPRGPNALGGEHAEVADVRTDVDERLAKAERRLEVSRLGWLPHPAVGELRRDDVVVARQQQRPDDRLHLHDRL